MTNEMWDGKWDGRESICDKISVLLKMVEDDEVGWLEDLKEEIKIQDEAKDLFEEILGWDG